MKSLFGCLLCLVLGTAQSFALKGGPVYPSGGTNIVGLYAGVMQGVFDPTNPAASNSIGIFTLGVPSTGNATGVFVMFSRGRVFTGTAQAFADPIKASLKGILSASFTYLNGPAVVVLNPDGTITVTGGSVTATATGPINAQIASSKTASLFSSSTTTLLRGDATLTISQGQVAANGDPVVTGILALVVSGVKQSNTAL